MTKLQSSLLRAIIFATDGEGLVLTVNTVEQLAEQVRILGFLVTIEGSTLVITNPTIRNAGTSRLMIRTYDVPDPTPAVGGLTHVEEFTYLSRKQMIEMGMRIEPYL